MNQLLKHRIFAVLLTLVVILPFAIQVSHAFENHEHVVCTAKDVKHFHEQELDSCLCCTPLELNTLLFSFADNTLKSEENVDSFNAITPLSKLDFFKLKSTRAPPIFSFNY